MYLSVSSIQEAGFQILSVLAYAILFKVILSGREPALKEKDRSMREQGISLVMSSFSTEIEDYSIQDFLSFPFSI